MQTRVVSLSVGVVILLTSVCTAMTPTTHPLSLPNSEGNSLTSVDNNLSNETILSSDVAKLQNDSLSKQNETFLDGFVSAFTVNILSELGDKTFFIAAFLAATNSRLVVFCGQTSALVFMTVMSMSLGYAAQYVPTYIIRYTSIVLFVLFAVKMFYDGVRLCLRERKSHQIDGGAHENDDTDAFEKEEKHWKRGWCQSAFFTAFIMTVCAEMGDRSQLAAILLAATKNIYGVATGTLLGHMVCTMLAVSVGRLISKYLSLSVLNILGACTFLLFAIVSIVQLLLERSHGTVFLGNSTVF